MTSGVPLLGVVLLSLGVLLEDALIAAAGIVAGVVGIALIVFLGRAAIEQAVQLAHQLGVIFVAVGAGPAPLVFRVAA